MQSDPRLRVRSGNQILGAEVQRFTEPEACDRYQSKKQLSDLLLAFGYLPLKIFNVSSESLVLALQVLPAELMSVAIFPHAARRCAPTGRLLAEIRFT